VNADTAGRQFRLSSLMIKIAYAAVLSALLFYPRMVEHPLSVATAFFLIAMLAIPTSLTRISTRTERSAFLVKQTLRNLYKSLVLFVLLWLASSSKTKSILLMVLCIVIVALPDWIHLLLKRRMASGSQKDRLLTILSYFVMTEEPPEGTTG
jgi:hypothetical protein